MIKYFVFFLFFSFLYNINYSFLPINLMVVIAFLGFILFLKNFIKQRNSVIKFILLSVLYLFSIPLFLLPTILINGTDFFYLREYFLIPLLMIFSAYFIYVSINYSFPLQRDKFILLLKFIIYSTLIQCILGLLMFFLPPIKIFLLSFISNDNSSLDKIVSISEFRMIGFGAQFFGLGVINSICLVIISYFIINNPSFTKKFALIFIYLFVFVVGMAMSRTTIVGFLVSIIMYFVFQLYYNKKIYLIFKYIFLIILTYVLFFIFFDYIQNNFISLKNNKMLSFAFELLINFFENKNTSSASTDAMIDMYNILPTNFNTWLYGDGMFRDVYKIGYYKHVDIGYLRIIFASGILGLFFFILIHYLVLKKLFKNIKYKPIAFSLFLILLFILLKGIMILYPLFVLLSFSSFYSFKKNN